jgi:hypothetical protein
MGMFVISYIVSIALIEWIFYFCSLFSLVVGIVMLANKGYLDANS